MASQRLEWLDFFRGAAAITVVAFHFHYGVHLPHFRFGPLAVDLFFVLSGIVLARRYHDAILAGMPFQEFAWHRIRRLYPMVLVVAAFIALMNALHIPELPWSYGSAAAIGSLLTVTGVDADPPMWSLRAELLANVVWFVCLKFGRWAAAAMFAVATAAFLAFTFADGGITTGVGHQGLAHYERALGRALAGFGVGCAISVFDLRARMPVWLALVALAGSCALVEMQRFNSALCDLLVIASGTALLMTLMHRTPRSAAVGRLCAALGMLSFPLYLIHMPASRLASWAASHGVRPTIAYVGTFLVVGTAATVLNEGILRRLPARIRLRRPPAANAAA